MTSTCSSRCSPPTPSSRSTGLTGPAAVFAGAEALATLPGAATLADLVRALDARYPQTFHLVGNHRARVIGDTATTETYCLAHHLHAAADGTPTDLRMLVHYADATRRGPDGVWRFHRRVITAKWQSPHPVDASVLDAAGRPPEQSDQQIHVQER
ncbi:nuclear transport factor 2 family protein [Frankia sp. AgKG'84/4]|uniref:nuclear transport factor 2 family protein n=1 Tax=Frankia sp. AgKG'84/4 TaxID=573490 RepID=UPI0035B0384B